MPKLYLPIPYPAFIAHICVWFLLRRRKKKYGIAFRKIKLACGKNEAQNKYALVNPEDYESLSRYYWQPYERENNRCYAVRLDNGRIIYMHRIITNAPAGKVVHHEDGNGLNNTKENLQIVTVAENNRCRRMFKPASSKYRGVFFEKKSKKWRASVKHIGITHHLGSFENEEDAARAYDEAAKIYHGEYAVLNFPQDEVADKQCLKQNLF